MSKSLFRPPVPCTWNGIEYRSMNEAAMALGICESTMRNRVLKGYTCDADLNVTRRRVACEWNGVKFNTLQEAADANWISREGMWYRVVKRGYKSDADMQGQNT